ncbi:MAG: hypothetical protein IJ309_05865 [Clostridia bacterium]|nr:hypothetical protein [Clostridia bacterium]
MSENNFEQMLSSITSNPDLMGKISEVVKNNKNGEISDTLPDVLSLIKSNLDESSKEVKKEPDVQSEGINQAASLGAIGEFSKQISKSAPLLLAIKPYLNKSRQGLIENIVRLSSLANVVNLAGLDLGKQS